MLALRRVPLRRAFARMASLRTELLLDIQKTSKFSLAEVEALQNQFARRSTTGQGLDKAEFFRCMRAIGVNDQGVSDKFFGAFDSDRNGLVDFKEFVSNLSLLSRGSAENKYRFVFKLWDEDSDGLLSKEQYFNFYNTTAHSPSLEVAKNIFAAIDRNGDGVIDFDEFKQGIAKHETAFPSPFLGIKSEDLSDWSPAEEQVLTLIGSRSTKLADLAKAGAGYIGVLMSGSVTLYRGDVEVQKLSTRGDLFSETSLFQPEAIFQLKASPDFSFTSIHVNDLLPLVYHGNQGAIAIVDRVGRTLQDRLQLVDEKLSASKVVDTSFVQVKTKLIAEWALKYHAVGKKGKLETIPTRGVGTAQDLSVAYSPGVAEPCLAIKADPNAAYEYTTKGHLVGVVSNGTAVLGLGDIGALASKPVMEGKAVLFKKFGGLDSFDIEINENDPDKLIDIIVSLEPTFGGINLEDIKAPECFYIEPRVQERMNIPIMHDDQHGTAIIAGAGLLNALEIVNKNIGDIKVVICGAGAAGFTCAKYFLSLGVKPSNLIAFDKDGAIYQGRADIESNPRLSYLKTIWRDTDIRSLEQALTGADVFLGLSAGGLLKPALLNLMARDPLVFALANPNPEISYPLARQTRSDVIMATGRSDFPNQINNVCAFPGIFRGAIDCRAKKINEEIKLAATQAIRGLAKNAAPGYSFGRDYIIPKPFDPRLKVEVSSAVAAAAMASGVARIQLDIARYRAILAAEGN